MSSMRRRLYVLMVIMLAAWGNTRAQQACGDAQDEVQLCLVLKQHTLKSTLAPFCGSVGICNRARFVARTCKNRT